MSREAELAAGLAGVRERIARAAAAAGRPADSVTLVVITKHWPSSDVRLLHALGIRDVGENRDQEAAEKAAQCADLNLRWHFVGQLQTNKARSVATYADVVHSVDRDRLVGALDHGAAAADRRVGVLIQVTLDGAGDRGGADPLHVPVLADRIAAAGSLDLLGLMAVAPLGAEPLPAFERLAAHSAALLLDHPEAGAISAGMSGDLEAAVRAGATHVRVGSAILGARPPLR